jgi:putative ABC transport system permease protein
VVILSDALWRRKYHADSKIVGTNIEINQQPFSVIGIMSPAFTFPFEGMPFSQAADLWTPLALTPDELRSTGASFSINLIARLHPGISVSQASSEADIMTSAFRRDHPELNTGNFQVTASAVAFRELLVENVRPFLLLLMGAVGALLLIACANVANLLLTRSLVRSHEIAVRTALGADRKRLIRQLLTESTLLALIGAGSGLLVAVVMIKSIRVLAPPQIVWPANLAPDPFILLFTLVLAIVTGIGFGLAPALRASRVDLNHALRESSSYSVAGPDSASPAAFSDRG